MPMKQVSFVDGVLMQSLKDNHFIFLLVVLNFLLTPLITSLLGLSGSIITVINFSLLILAGSVLAQGRNTKAFGFIFGSITMLAIWLEYGMDHLEEVHVIRMISSLILFIWLFWILIVEFINAKRINGQMISGAIAGYVILGIVGGVLFEILEYHMSESIGIQSNLSGYSFYYFSFVSLTTVGYGDITPLTPQAQSLAVVLSIIGQFYLTLGVAIFVGKYLNQSQKDV